MAELVNAPKLSNGKYVKLEISVNEKDIAIRLAKTLVENRMASSATLEAQPILTFENTGFKKENKYTISALTEARFAESIQKLLNHFQETKNAEMIALPILAITPALALKITENLKSLPKI